MTDRAKRTIERSPEGAGRMRADARRNVETLLRAAMAVFAKSGVDAPVREIAEKAGVGIGTVYRHFPQRSDLIVAVFENEVDACADAADVLAAEHPPGEALARWIQRYVDFIANKRGLSKAFQSGDPAYQNVHGYFDRRLRPALQRLLDAAAEAGEARSDVDPNDLLHAVARLSAPGPTGGPDISQRMISLLLAGVRQPAPEPARGRAQRSSRR